MSFNTTSCQVYDCRDNKIKINSDEKRLDIEFEIEGPNVLNKDILNIINIVVNDTETNHTVSEKDTEKSIYHVYQDKEGEKEVLKGNLEWNEEHDEWEKLNINLAWSGYGKFYVTLEFQTEDMKESIETDIEDDEWHSYGRSNLLEIFLQVMLFVGIGIGIVVAFLLIRAKRQGVSVERKVKEPKEQVKIKEISEDELKSAKKKEKKGKQEEKAKGKTEVKEDLIFSVPKWESDEDKEDKK